MVQNKAFTYISILDGWPVPGKNLTIEASEFDATATAPANGLILENQYATFRFSQRERMRNPTIRSCTTALELDKPAMAVLMIGKVLRTDRRSSRGGDHRMCWMWPTGTHSLLTEETDSNVSLLVPTEGVPLTAHLGPLGMTGLTAYGSPYEIGRSKRSETILITGAAGSVGQIVGQIALREGLMVIASVGDD